jgi:serine beta-lactamase-like protein LACTB
MRWNRASTWFGLIAIAVCLVLAAVVGLWTYITSTAVPLHRSPDNVTSVSTGAPSPRWAAAIDRGRQLVRIHLAERSLPGISVAVGIADDVVWAEGFGWADMERQVAVTPATQFRIGTASTALTSAAVGLLVEKQRLTLDNEIHAYVPEFPRHEWPVTLRQLMGHVAGVRNDGGDEGPLLAQHCERAIDALPSFGRQALLFEPGTRYHYSSYGWILVSAAIEAVAGEPVARVMRKQIFEPLGMDDTTADSPTESLPDLATSYFPRFMADPRYGPDVMRLVDYSCYGGSSGFVSTPADLVRFGVAMDRGTLLRPATLHLLQTPQRLASGQETGYGLGWDLEAVTLAGAPVRSAGHDGDVLGGMAASLLTFREPGIVVAVTSNISYADTRALGVSIAQSFATALASAAPDGALGPG